MTRIGPALARVVTSGGSSVFATRSCPTSICDAALSVWRAASSTDSATAAAVASSPEVLADWTASPRSSPHRSPVVGSTVAAVEAGSFGSAVAGSAVEVASARFVAPAVASHRRSGSLVAMPSSECSPSLSRPALDPLAGLVFGPSPVAFLAEGSILRTASTVKSARPCVFSLIRVSFSANRMYSCAVRSLISHRLRKASHCPCSQRLFASMRQ